MGGEDGVVCMFDDWFLRWYNNGYKINIFELIVVWMFYRGVIYFFVFEDLWFVVVLVDGSVVIMDVR